jgi:hypothetical protein
VEEVGISVAETEATPTKVSPSEIFIAHFSRSSVILLKASMDNLIVLAVQNYMKSMVSNSNHPKPALRKLALIVQAADVRKF